jgi:hypoxanthine phosphoribosyltransferase
MASSKRVTFKEFSFEEYLDEPTILTAVAKIAAQIAEDYRDKNPLFIVVLNGAYVFAADLLREIPFNCETSFIKLKSYSGFKSTEKVEQLLGLENDISGRDIILIEDIIDTGNTLNKFLPVVREHNVASVRLATLLFKASAFKHSYLIDYIGIEIPDDFVIGYGLDYDDHGRNLRSIYRKVD